MNRRNFLSSSAKLMLVTSGLFVTGKLMTSCNNDDDGGYNGGFYSGGYYDDRPSGNANQTPKDHTKHDHNQDLN